MDKVKEKALKAYPEILNWDFRDIAYDPNERLRQAFMQGYKEALSDIKQVVLDVYTPKFWFNKNKFAYKILGIIESMSKTE